MDNFIFVILEARLLLSFSSVALDHESVDVLGEFVPVAPRLRRQSALGRGGGLVLQAGDALGKAFAGRLQEEMKMVLKPQLWKYKFFTFPPFLPGATKSPPGLGIPILYLFCVSPYNEIAFKFSVLFF
jgi:hypothetical protein